MEPVGKKMKTEIKMDGALRPWVFEGLNRLASTGTRPSRWLIEWPAGHATNRNAGFSLVDSRTRLGSQEAWHKAYIAWFLVVCRLRTLRVLIGYEVQGMLGDT